MIELSVYISCPKECFLQGISWKYFRLNFILLPSMHKVIPTCPHATTWHIYSSPAYPTLQLHVQYQPGSYIFTRFHSSSFHRHLHSAASLPPLLSTTTIPMPILMPARATNGQRTLSMWAQMTQSSFGP
jgi:hypothetical protein